MASSSSSPPSNWDVFLSFYGKDTRRNFISYLYKALDETGILTFRDDPALEKGAEISSGLLNAIKDSKMFVVVISENYARSSWCLDELVQILSCKTRNNQVVPVFYYVDPSDLRHQKGCFGEALDYHKKRFSLDMIDKWKSALAQIAELSGYHLQKHANENESETIQQIVENVARQVSTKSLHLEKDLFGIEYAVEEIYQKLRMELNHVGAIGICGMGGIGKTTTAKAFYNKYSNRFDISCFIDKVKQYSQGGSPLLPLLNQVLTGILRKKDYKVTDVESGFRQLKQILHFKKALIVLDDLDQSSYSEFLATICNLFSAGSRIIVTTRDVKLVNQLRIDITEVDIYMVRRLGEVNSLELFSYHAFRTLKPPANLEVLSKSFVTYAGGLPLALKVLGSSLCGTQDELFWKAKLKKVRKIPENDVLEILQLSYYELGDKTVKSIFLDIAFFFVGKNQYNAFEMFKSCDFYPEVGIPILLERCLLTIEDDKFQMHDLLQEMGRKLSKNTHLFLRGNEWEVLQNQKESDSIAGFILDMTQSIKKEINSQIFEKMPKLRLLELVDVHDIEGDLKSSFNELRCIYWSNCTWRQLPSNFRPPKLISLDMPFSSFIILWDDAMPFKNLKCINVEYSVNFKRTPDFENSKLVERLGFRGCEGLLEIHPSIIHLTGLHVLDLEGCTLLKELPEPVGQSTMGDLSIHTDVIGSPEPMKKLANKGYLHLGFCSNIRRLPKKLGDMKWLKELDASYTAIEELPDSITQLKGLLVLKLSHCKNLKRLPEQMGSVEGLRTFSASCCAIEVLPDSFVGLINLVQLDLSCCKNLLNLPNSIWKLTRLEVLDLELCLKLERLPEQLGKMQSLKVLDAYGTAIEKVPDSIGLLSGLRKLDLCFCKKLKNLPNSVWNLTSVTHLGLLQMGIGIIHLPDMIKYKKLVALALSCDIRLWLPMILSLSGLKQLILCDEGENLSPTKPFSLSKLYNLQFLEFYNCTGFGSLFPELPPNLTHLSLHSHATLVNLPDLSSLKWLKKLEIVNYISLKLLPPLPSHLRSLTVYHCKSLHDLPNMSMLKDLVEYNFGRYSNLKSFGLKQSVLKNAERFSYKSRGRTLFCDIPPLLEDDFLGLALWVLFTCEGSNRFNISAVVTNKTNGMIKNFRIPVFCIGNAEVYSLVRCVSGDEISVRSGDRIEISFKRQLYSLNGEVEVPYEEVKLEICGAQVMQKTPITPYFSSLLSHLIDV